MTVKSFSSILIGIGIFLIFAFFVFSKWNVNLDFIQNIRYATLMEIESDSSYKTTKITLGQGLLFPILIIGVGVALTRNIIDSDLVIKVLPFLKNESDDKKPN